jgi:CRP-like cAMP-binding protein
MDEIADFVRSQPIKRFAKDNIIVFQDELPAALYAIRSGYVKIYDLSRDGNEQLLGLAGKFDFIPSELLFGGTTSAQFFYAAFTPVEVYVVNKQLFLDKIQADSATLYAVAQTVTRKYHALLHHLSAVQKPKAREKIIYALYFLAAYFLSDTQIHSRRMPLALTQQDIANLVGVTRETAAHELKILKSEGYIAYTASAFYINSSLTSLIA